MAWIMVGRVGLVEAWIMVGRVGLVEAWIMVGRVGLAWRGSWWVELV